MLWTSFCIKCGCESVVKMMDRCSLLHRILVIGGVKKQNHIMLSKRPCYRWTYWAFKQENYKTFKKVDLLLHRGIICERPVWLVNSRL